MGSWLKAAKDSANQQDVLTDTFDSFVPETMRHNMHRSNTHKVGHMRLHDEPEENGGDGGEGSSGRRRANTDDDDGSSGVGTSAAAAVLSSPSQKEEGHFINQNLERTLSEDDASLQSNRR